MATELITRTWCDVDHEDDEKVEATTWRFGINPPGERWEWVEIDLCPAHVSSDFAAMAEVLAKYGRSAPHPPRGGGRPPRQMPATAAGEFICPDCGQATRTKQGLGTHRARIHGVPGVKHQRADVR